MGSVTLYLPNMTGFTKKQKITFEQPFPKTPKAQTALQYIGWSSSVSAHLDVYAEASEVTKTGMQFKMGTNGYDGLEYITGMWIACL